MSVIIPTLNAGAELTELLARLQRQTVRPHEIIIMDSESIDGTQDRAREAGVRLLSVARSEFDHGGTRNRAAEHAEGDILMFMTQDALPYDDRLIEQLTKPLISSEKVVYAYARQLARPDANVLERLAREHNYPGQSEIKSYEDIETLGIKTFFCSNVCSAIKRDVFEEMGRFQEPVIFNEDLFMAAKCILSGYSTAYCAEAIVYHSHDYSISQQFRRYFDNGVSMSLNTWIIPYSAVGKAGSKLVKLQLLELMRAGRWFLVPKLIGEAGAKLIGYKLGMNYRRLPAFLSKRFVMHRAIFKQLENKTGGASAGGTISKQQAR
ncbi:glycosyltransferase family 2 protein [Paenibacillus arenilitoris]|uniref:Glycosyltransferase family 2 protein n=1 Tax=Paenibacillus arenilitoris TaxID=2772299 RepID=A0A927CJ02_9BACL|nr:glycosyltransferase family 2 protein [Paenibacillus arenilitoris]MBD2867972.1 glycosyltransferase family 2 protein [Paenibacillus arenilitoris]